MQNLNQNLPSLFAPPIQQRTPEHPGANEIEFFTQNSEDKLMKVSARNIFKGTVKQVVTGAVNTEVILEIAPGVEVTSMITRTSAEQLGLVEGKIAYAVIKSSDVMIGVD